MSLKRIREYPTKQPFESADNFAKRLRDAIQEEAADRIQDFDILQLGNVPWIDVRTYGAKGDGATDDTVAIQAAIDSGGPVLFPEGNFLANSTLTLKTKVSLLGSQRGLTKITSGITDSSDLFSTDSTEVLRTVISNIYFLGNGSEGDCFNLHTFRRGNTLENLAIVGFGGSGIHFTQDCWQNVIQSCRITTCDKGMELGDQANANRIIANDITDCTTYGIDTSVGAGNSLSNLILIGNNVENCGSAIILDRVLGGSILGNRVENCTTYGIYLSIACKAINIISNYIQGNDTTTEGIASSASTGVNIIGNFLRSCSDYGIRLRTTDDYVYVSNNYYDGTMTFKIGNARPAHYYISDPSAGILQTNMSMVTADNSDTSTSGTGEDDLNTYTVVADSMGTTGGIEIIAAGTKTGGNDDKTIKLYFGATSWTVHAAANNTDDWILITRIYNTAANAQRIFWQLSGPTNLVASGYETATIDTTANVTLKLTGECVNASDSITQTMWHMKRL